MTTLMDRIAEAPTAFYLLVLHDRSIPSQHPFSASSDDRAGELMRRQFPNSRWTLYRTASGECRPVASYPPGPSAATDSTPASSGAACLEVL